MDTFFLTTKITNELLEFNVMEILSQSPTKSLSREVKEVAR